MREPVVGMARRGREALIAGLAALLVLSSTTPALAEPAAKKRKVTYTYSLQAKPDEFAVCIGQTKQYTVRVQRQAWTAAAVSAALKNPLGPVPRSRDIPGAVVKSGAALHGTVDPSQARAVPLILANGARSQNYGARFAYTRTEPGLEAMINSHPESGQTVPVLVRDCKYKVNISTAWDIPGPDVQHTAKVKVQNAILVPQGQANTFSLQVTPSSTVVRSGLCGGSASMTSGAVSISGEVSTTGVVHVRVNYAAGSYTASEGCMGKSDAGSQQPQSLDFKVDTSSGAKHYFLNLPQTLQGTPTVQGYADVDFEVLEN